jgi:hypothetical protein
MVQLNHNSSTMGEAMGISKDRQDVITASVFFEIVNNDYQVMSLYDDPEEAPREMVTTSGVLQKALSRVSNEQERMYMIWEFAKTDTVRNSKMSDHFDKMLQAVSMIFMMCDKDYNKFVKRFTAFQRQAEEEIKRRGEQE